MNILFICDEYPPGRNGGIGTMVQILSRELVKHGHTVFVAGLYAHSYGGAAYEESQGVKVWRFRYGWNLFLNADHIVHKIFNRIPGFIKKHLNGRKAFERFITFTNALIEKEHIDIIEIADWNTFAMRIGFLVQWPMFKVPLVVKSHGSYTYFADEMGAPAKKNLKAIDDALFKRADAIVAVSAYTANKDKQLFAPTRKISVLYNAIESPAITDITKKDYTAVFTGTLIEKKGIFQLMKAWNLVHEKIPQARLVVMGKGDSERVRALLNAAAKETVIFKGHVSRQELFNELAGATVAVFPSFSETFGLAPVEAMSVGCPAIFTTRSSGPEIITNGVNGELIDPEDVPGLAESIIRIMSSKELQLKYALEGKKTVRDKFNSFVSAREHIVFYKRVIDEFKTENDLQK